MIIIHKVFFLKHWKNSSLEEKKTASGFFRKLFLGLNYQNEKLKSVF